MSPNDQLTDGGPPPASELPSSCAGPPFGGAPLLGLHAAVATSAAANTGRPTSTAMTAAVTQSWSNDGAYKSAVAPNQTGSVKSKAASEAGTPRRVRNHDIGT